MHNQIVAKEILTSLASGTVPMKYAYSYDVGRKKQIEVVINEIINNESKLRFVNGDYGTGKTHFLSTIRHRAIQNNFVPSHVILSPRETPVHNLIAVYSRMIKNLILSDTDNLSPIEAILEFVFHEFKIWLSEYMKCEGNTCEKYLLNSLYCTHCNLDGIIEKLYIRDFEKLDRKLRVAIIVYRYARWGHHPDFETADLVIRWLEGEPLYRRNLNYLGTWDHVEERDILRGLQEVAKLVALLNKKGLIIMLDEAEGIENLNSNQRPIAYANLKFLIEGTKNIDNVYFLYATTPTFYQEIKSNAPNLNQIVNRTSCTELAPLSKNELEELSTKIAEIYMTAMDINENPFNLKYPEIMRGIDNTYNKSNASVRDFITNLIGLFNMS